MSITEEIFSEYEEQKQFKESLGDKGISEQGLINTRFFSGDQWKGANVGNERPLVRHNIIKRIGDFKMAQIMSGEAEINYLADGIPNTVSSRNDIKNLKQKIISRKSRFEGEVTQNEINLVLSAISDYRKVCAERLDFDSLCAKALRDSYINGSSIIYTYWDSTANFGKGDIGCEVLSVNDVYFADPYEKNIDEQPFIIISSLLNCDFVCREATSYNSAADVKAIKEASDSGKVLVLTKLYKEYGEDGKFTIKCIKVTENAVIREPFDTNLTMYPISLFNFTERDNTVYGESEITYLIPNQIAINRLITANVWANMNMGMPMMVVNGDTVSGDITNDPGQIIKVYGSNEDVKGAINFVSLPDYSEDFNKSINNLIENTLNQSGANSVVLGDVSPDNAEAIKIIRDTALLSLKLTKNRYYAFIKRIARIWADFYLNSYGDRELCIEDENGIWYFPFSAKRYNGIQFVAKVTVNEKSGYTKKDTFDMLLTLFEKGIISKEQFLKRLPEGIFPNTSGLLIQKEDSL